MRTLKLVAVLAIVAILGSYAWAQTGNTSLRGTVTDPNGAVISGATVTLTNPSQGYSRSTKTNDTGAYQFLEVTPATYSITVSAPGFADLKRSNVPLMVNTPATLDLRVQIAGGATTVEVSGEAPLVNTQDASLGNAFSAIQ